MMSGLIWSTISGTSAGPHPSLRPGLSPLTRKACPPVPPALPAPPAYFLLDSLPGAPCSPRPPPADLFALCVLLEPDCESAALLLEEAVTLRPNHF